VEHSIVFSASSPWLLWVVVILALIGALVILLLAAVGLRELGGAIARSYRDRRSDPARVIRDMQHVV
jgi:hypothetical protein